AFATSAKFSTKWWEFDAGWLVVRFLQVFGLAKPRRVVQKPTLCATKTAIDAGTIQALITHRFQIMAQYAYCVISPILKLERKQASAAGRALLRYAKSTLIRDASIMKPVQHKRLNSILAHFQNLQVAYNLRMKLQAIWTLSSATQKEL